MSFLYNLFQKNKFPTAEHLCAVWTTRPMWAFRIFHSCKLISRRWALPDTTDGLRLILRLSRVRLTAISEMVHRNGTYLFRVEQHLEVSGFPQMRSCVSEQGLSFALLASKHPGH